MEIVEINKLCPELFWSESECEFYLGKTRLPDEIVNLLAQSRQQLAQRDAEMIDLTVTSKKFMEIASYTEGTWPKFCDAHNELTAALWRSQATAEAHDAKVREQAIREVLELRYLVDKNDSPDKDDAYETALGFVTDSSVLHVESDADSIEELA